MENTTALSDQQLQAILEITLDLTASLGENDRYERLLDVIRRVVPYDAACLLRLEGTELVPVATHGLIPETASRRFDRRDHPRLDVILNSKEPVRFPVDSPLADPFDGLLSLDGGHVSHDRIHACLGCALTEGGEVVGALTADALEPHAFDHLDQRWIAMLGALAGAAVRTTSLIQALERRAEHRGQVAREVMRNVVESSGGEILGTSAKAVRLRQEIAIVASSDLAVLIAGETGVGKELVAHQVHAASARADEAFIQVNCAAIPEPLVESELFGHVSGAFTGASRDRAGKFEIADGGTLFLDEIGELPLSSQPKLLRALQHGEIQRIGSDRVHRVHVRVIAATNRNLEQEVERGRFRADLFHRLAVFPLHVPPLRERREDIALLAAHFMSRARRRLGTGEVKLTAEAQRALFAADWPGNVRELENVVSRAVLRASFGQPPSHPITVGIEHLLLPTSASTRVGPDSAEALTAKTVALPLRERLEEFQREVIRESLGRNGGKWAAVARELGLHRSNLHSLARRLGLLPRP